MSLTSIFFTISFLILYQLPKLIFSTIIRLPTTHIYFLHNLLPNPSTNYPYLFSPQSSSQSHYQLPTPIFSTTTCLPNTQTDFLQNQFPNPFTNYANLFSLQSTSQFIFQLPKRIFHTINLPIRLPSSQTYFLHYRPSTI